LCGPKAPTKSWPASPASPSARQLPRPPNLCHEPLLQDTSAWQWQSPPGPPAPRLHLRPSERHRLVVPPAPSGCRSRPGGVGRSGAVETDASDHQSQNRKTTVQFGKRDLLVDSKIAAPVEIEDANWHRSKLLHKECDGSRAIRRLGN